MNQSVADAIAAHVLRRPHQYFWFHRLWGKDVVAAAEEPRPDPAAEGRGAAARG